LTWAIGVLATAILLSIVVVPVWTELLGRYFGVEASVPPSKVVLIA
jgi:hypothetical protein